MNLRKRIKKLESQVESSDYLTTEYEVFIDIHGNGDMFPRKRINLNTHEEITYNSLEEYRKDNPDYTISPAIIDQADREKHVLEKQAAIQAEAKEMQPDAFKQQPETKTTPNSIQSGKKQAEGRGDVGKIEIWKDPQSGVVLIGKRENDLDIPEKTHYNPLNELFRNY